MACDTFIKIANKCKRHFVALQAGENEPFIDEIVRTLRKITIDLTPQQVHTFYEACGHMISAQGQKSQQERLIAELMSYPNQAVRPHLPGLPIILMNEYSGIQLLAKPIMIPQHSKTAKLSKSLGTS